MEDIDFDPLTEEGQVDINDEEYESIINDDVDPGGFRDAMIRRFGNRLRGGYREMKRMWQSRNPGKSVPEIHELRDIPEAPTQEWANEVINAMNERGDDEEKTDIQRAKELFPNLVSNKIPIAWVEDKYGQEVLVAKLNQSNAKLYTVVDGDGRFHDLPPTLEGALGSTSHTLDEVKYAFPNVDLAQIDIRKNGKLQVKHHEHNVV